MIRSRSKTKINCLDCGKELLVRNDYIKTHKGRCRGCSKLIDWKREEYAKKCRESHIGQINACRLPYGEANFNGLLHSYKQSAESRGIEFSLTKEQFRIITSQNCYYCGVEPLQMYDLKSKKWDVTGRYVYNGIDRKDDAFGYIVNNCVPACKICNYAKQGLTDTEFLEHIKKIYSHNFLGSRTEYSK